MTCRTFQSLMRLGDLLPVSAIAPVARRLEAHSDACAACSAYRRSYAAVPGLLRRTHEQLLAECAAPATWGSPHRRPGRWAPHGIWAGLTLGGAAVAALVLVTGRLNHGNSLREGPPVQAGRLVRRPASPSTNAPDWRAPGPDAPGGPGPRAAPAAPLAGRVHRPQAARPGAPERVAAADRHERPPAPLPDDRYFDGRDPHLLAHWMVGDAADPQVLAWVQEHLLPAQDDFVRIRLPQLASADLKSPAAAEAARQYAKEAGVVDSRLFRKVTLALKAAPLSDLCAQLRRQTGVDLQARRGVADEKVTVFVDERPARDVMREVARLFGFFWGRSGTEGAYRYSLEQDLRSQLAEEEMRSKDVHAALIALDEQLAQFKPYLERTPEQIRAEYERIKEDRQKKEEQGRLWSLFNGAYGPLLLYYRLAPAERAALFAGEWLRFETEGSNPDRRLPVELRMPLLKSSNLVMYASGTILQGGLHRDAPSTPIDQVPNADPEALLHLDRSEAGDFSLEAGTYACIRSGGKITSAGGFSTRVATGRSPSAAKPDNAAANAALQKEPLFRREIPFKPKPSCPRLGLPATARESQELYRFEAALKDPHVNTADVWEEVHARTGLPVVADSYTRLYPVTAVASDKGSTFDVLCKAGDALGVRWKKDSDFILARSTTYFWDKVKEVPNRLLEQWKQDSARNGGLPLEDLLEMAGLSDQQLGSKNVGLGITHCWGLDEWGIIGGGPFIAGEIIPEEVLKTARNLRGLGPGELKAMQQDGLPLGMLAPEKLRALDREFGRWNQDGSVDRQTRAKIDYVPSGWYVWSPFITRARYESEGKRWPLVYGRKKEEVLARARRYDPGAAESSVRWTRGRLDWGVITPDGVRNGTGGVRVEAPLN